MTIAQNWQQFAAAVINPAAPEVQFREMRRAFYAGYWAAMNENARLEMLPDPAQARARIALHEEATAFCSDVAKGAR